MNRRDGKPKQYTHQRYWTEAAKQRCMLLVEEGLPNTLIAKRIGRSENAVHVFASRHLQRKRRGCPGYRPLSARAVARMMGVGCCKTVTRWVCRGWLQGHRKLRAGPNRRVAVQYSDLLSFLENSEHWHRWNADAIKDSTLQRFVAETRSVRYLTPGQVARRFFVQPSSVNDWIHRGLLPAKRWGNWWIADGALEGFVPPYLWERRRAS